MVETFYSLFLTSVVYARVNNEVCSMATAKQTSQLHLFVYHNVQNHGAPWKRESSTILEMCSIILIKKTDL